MTSYRVVDTQDETVVAFGDQRLPSVGVIEDEDAVRILVVPRGSVLRTWWEWAHTQGAQAILRHDRWAYITASQFIENRQSSARSGEWLVPEPLWRSMSGPMRYREMIIERDQPRVGQFVQLHCHSEFSALDGYSKIQEIVDHAVADDEPYVAVTDHGSVAAHPHLFLAAKKAGIIPVFGIEANLVGDRSVRAPSKPARKNFENDAEYKAAVEAWEPVAKAAHDYYHLILWAQTQEGLHNLWAMSTESHRTGFYSRPRVDWELLQKFSEGLIVSGACLRGPIARHLADDDIEGARVNLSRLTSIFRDRVYLELHTNQLEKTKKTNVGLIDLSSEFGLGLIAVVDSHYPTPDDKMSHQMWLRAQTKKDLTDAPELFEGNQDYHLMTAAEVRSNLSYLPGDVVDGAMAMTVQVASQCKAEVTGKAHMPIYSKVGGEEKDFDRLLKMCLEAWDRKVVGKPDSEEEYEKRLGRELSLLRKKHYCGYYLVVADYCQWARAHHILMGPGRGSGGASLVAYLCGIVEIDPVENDLPFERFLTEGRESPPDFDLDFPASKRPALEAYIIERWGADSVVRVGTQTRLKNRGVVRDLARVLKGTVDVFWPDVEAFTSYVSKVEAPTAGKGVSWDELWSQAPEEIMALRTKYPLLFDTADHHIGRLKSYGRHAAGFVISTDGPLTDRYPMRMAEDQVVTEFDMVALEALGLLKFDTLTLRTLDTVQMCLDLVAERHGIEIDVYSWREEFNDPMVWDMLCEGWTQGIFQVETTAGTQLTRRVQPRSVAQLADVITLDRPGPMKSGLVDHYIRRKRGDEEITYAHPLLEPILSGTFGTMIYQEQVMAICRVFGGYNDTEADNVRSILGKKKVEQANAAGIEFVRRCLENGYDKDFIEAIWDQMKVFSSYAFNKAHAFGYAVVAFWTAWFKCHWPQEFLVAALSTVDKDRVPEFVNEARRMGYAVLTPDINLSGTGFAIEGTTVRYGIDNIKGIAEKGLNAVLQGQPYSSFADFIERKGAGCDMGTVKLLVRSGAFDSLISNRAALEARLEYETSGDFRCVDYDPTVSNHNLPCRFDWDAEPTPIGKSGRPLKRKPIPKKCSRACRQYREKPAPDFDAEVRAYTEEEIRNIEMDLLGVYLSSTPFDAFGDDLKMMYTASDVDSGPQGEYLVPGIVKRIKLHTDRTGKEMAFVSLYAQTSDIDVTIFSKMWEKVKSFVVIDHMVLMLVYKNERGLTLNGAMPAD